MKNKQISNRQSLINQNIIRTTCSSWASEYFSSKEPNQNVSPYIFNDLRQSQAYMISQQYQRMASFYKAQNQEIHFRNINLKQIVRDLKQKQNCLLTEIAELEAYYRKLQKQTKTQNQEQSISQTQKNKQNQNINNNNLLRNKSQKVFKSHLTEFPAIDQQEESQCKNIQKKDFMRDLNQQFCSLVEDSLAEKDTNKKKDLRKQLALLAGQMKKLKKNYNQYGLQTCHQDKSMSCFTSKTLAPYLSDCNSTKQERQALKDAANSKFMKKK